MALDGSLGGRGQTSDEIVGAIRSAGVPDPRFFSHGLTSSVTLGNLGLWPGLKWAPATGQEGTGAHMRSAADPLYPSHAVLGCPPRGSREVKRSETQRDPRATA